MLEADNTQLSIEVAWLRLRPRRTVGGAPEAGMIGYPSARRPRAERPRAGLHVPPVQPRYLTKCGSDLPATAGPLSAGVLDLREEATNMWAHFNYFNYFWGCSSLRDHVTSQPRQDLKAHIQPVRVQDHAVMLPPNLTEIAQSAFYGGTSLSEITLPPGPFPGLSGRRNDLAHHRRDRGARSRPCVGTNTFFGGVLVFRHAVGACRRLNFHLPHQRSTI